MVTSAEDSEPLPSSHAESVTSLSDSRITATDSLDASSSRSTNTITLTPGSSTSSLREKTQEKTLRTRASNIQGKEISSPISVRSSTPWMTDKSVSDSRNHEGKLLRADISTLPGWCNPTAPAFSLISLEEARAQRSRSVTASAAISRPSQSSDSPSRIAPFSDPGIHPNNNSAMPNSRMRSTSAGIRSKLTADSSISSDMQQPSPQSTAPAKSPLKHKKSGFMRIFTSRDREKDRDKTSPPIVDDHDQRPVEFPKFSSRVPVPPITPPNNSPTTVPSPSFVSSSSPGSDRHLAPTANPQKTTPSPRRFLHPALSINTSTPSQTNRALSALSSETRYSSWVTTPPMLDADMMPQSAPALVTDFPALKLRPVSTMFSAHFREHIVKTDSESEEPDNYIQSPASSGQETRPVTPGLFSRSDSSAVVSSEDPASVIQALQSQISSSRKAWQLEIWDLEGQVKDLKAELEDLRASEKEYCDTCGRGRRSGDVYLSREGARSVGIVNRPRARTGTVSRFVNGG